MTLFPDAHLWPSSKLPTDAWHVGVDGTKASLEALCARGLLYPLTTTSYLAADVSSTTTARAQAIGHAIPQGAIACRTAAAFIHGYGDTHDIPATCYTRTNRYTTASYVTIRSTPKPCDVAEYAGTLATTPAATAFDLAAMVGDDTIAPLAFLLHTYELEDSHIEAIERTKDSSTKRRISRKTILALRHSAHEIEGSAATGCVR